MAWAGTAVLSNHLDDLERFAWAGHRRPVALPGGTAAICEPWRTAASRAVEVFDPEGAASIVAGFEERWPQVRDVVRARRAMVTTSVGRRFDAVVAFIGLWSRVTYEGWAAIEVETVARTVPVAAFHQSPAARVVDAAVRVASQRGLDTAALSGGVFQNARLTGQVAPGLRAAGLRVLIHRRVPPNDAGISFGQRPSRRPSVQR